ncbi:MAG: PRC-barrel domain-containing protein [Pseudomonadota bacterium]|nr:PRC-barrel domain-containing protein [Pseudomonadota bacterium]
MQDKHSGHKATAQQATAQKATEQKARLAPLGELEDYKVKEGNPDIRRWEVFGADSLRIGEVRELIVDTGAMKARYMVIVLDRTLPNVAGERRVLVPIGRARLDDALDRVYLDDVTIATAHALPDYDPTNFNPSVEWSLFGGGIPAPPPPVSPPQTSAPAAAGSEAQVAPVAQGTPAHDPDFYNRPEYDSNRFFGRRKQDANEPYVVLHKEQVTIEPVGDSVEVTREQVTVERYPVGPDGRIVDLNEPREAPEADVKREADARDTKKKEPV